jgi:hypothetical protein
VLTRLGRGATHKLGAAVAQWADGAHVTYAPSCAHGRLRQLFILSSRLANRSSRAQT